MKASLQKQYEQLLRQYLENQNEKSLYYAQQFSRKFIETEIAPEDVVSMHKDAHLQASPTLPKEVKDSYDFLIEMMIHYGLALQEHKSMLKKREELQLEISVASNVQRTLLKTPTPHVEGVDIGYVSEAANQMSGDYVYFAAHGDDLASVAVADVIGKGIPAALCMSMIKFGMDSVTEEETQPHNVLTLINRIVEKSISDMMFISMFYGVYDKKTSTLTYGSAGHEPALLYRKETDRIQLLDAQGLLLGVMSEVIYEEKEVVLQSGDFVAIMTDGVTEVKVEDEFVSDEALQQFIYDVREMSAQQIASTMYDKIMQMQGFKLRDDFTLVVLKKQ